MLSAQFAPPIGIERDGAHWYRTWLMLRDSLVWWPWFDRRQVALRRAPVDFEAKRLHAWTVDVMRRRASYGHLIHAALAHDVRAEDQWQSVFDQAIRYFGRVDILINSAGINGASAGTAS